MRQPLSTLVPVLVVLSAGSLPVRAEEPPAQLLARLLAPTPIVADLAELTDTIGGRPTGSPALDRAVEWGLGRFREAGLENVHAEEYVAPRLWLPGPESAEVTQPRAPWQPAERAALHVAALAYSSPTPAAGLEAEVADVGSGEEAGFAAAGGRVRGRLLLLHTEPMRSIDDLFKEYLETPGIESRARAGGAAGILWTSNRPGRLLYRHNLTLDGSLSPLPGAVVEREGALRLVRLLAAGQTVKVRLRLASSSPTEARAKNVVAEVRGREKPEEVVILGAHLDSWDLGRGALDNGCNASLVLDVARQAMALARAGLRPRRTLRFILYSGEEAGLFGSFGEVRLHRAELDRVKAQVIYDEGTGRTTGFSLGGRADLKPAVEAALATAGALGPFEQTTDAFVGTDNYDYLLEGVPNLVANQAGAPYLPDYHAESDTYDKADLRELKANAAIAGVLVWGLADAAAPPGPRQSRAEVVALLKATGLDEQMKSFGLWPGFASGARGRQP
ncbi:MAG TPA: M28 family peptidase [Thermoanaerobaculia bacterium]|nr:M28 family peptidase [Thermoanaerobaculia bacterium]